MNQHIIELKKEIEKDSSILHDASRLSSVVYSIFSDNEYVGRLIVYVHALGIAEELQEKHGFQELSVVRYHLMLEGKYNILGSDAEIALAYWADILDIDKSLLKNVPKNYESYGYKNERSISHREEDIDVHLDSNSNIVNDKFGEKGENSFSQKSDYNIKFVPDTNKRNKRSLLFPLFFFIICSIGIILFYPSVFNIIGFPKLRNTSPTVTPSNYTFPSPKVSNKPVKPIEPIVSSPTIETKKEDLKETERVHTDTVNEETQNIQKENLIDIINEKNGDSSRPANGTVFINFYQDCPIELTINNKLSKDCYVKLIDKYDITALTVYVYKNSSTTIKAPVGTYTVEYSKGDNWIDNVSEFGESTETVALPEKSVFPFLDPIQSISLES